MALAKKDYDAQKAEELLTTIRSQWQTGMPPRGAGEATTLQVAQVYAAIAQAHALEELARKLDVLIDCLEKQWQNSSVGSHAGKGQKS